MAGSEMPSTRPRVTIADVEHALRAVTRLLGDDFEVCCASTWDEGLKCLEEQRPHVAVVGYHFDNVRADRFLRHVRARSNASELGVVVIRAVPALSSSVDETETEKSYRQLGADVYMILDPATGSENFTESSQRLRSAVWNLHKKLAAK
jgi:response regulator RpfG family c-di-GMP phosphodiesterase